jgi:retron-type reverse transcriptase
MSHNQLIKYLAKHSLIYENQFGFRPNHSTQHCVLKLLNIVSKKVEENNHVFVIFLDFTKAFDCVNHAIFFKKLSMQFNFSDKSIK